MAVPIEETEVMEEAEEFPLEDSTLVRKKGFTGLTIIAMAGAVAILVSAAYILFSFSLPKILQSPNWLILAFRMFVLLVIGLSIPYFLGLYLISRLTTNFFDRFYNPPEGTNSRDLILSRLYGYGGFVPIRGEQLEPLP